MVVVEQYSPLAFVKDISSSARHFIWFSCASSLVWCRLLISYTSEMKSRALILVLCMRYFFCVFHFSAGSAWWNPNAPEKRLPELLCNVKSILFPFRAPFSVVIAVVSFAAASLLFFRLFYVCVRSLYVVFYSLMLVIRFGRSHSVFPYLLHADVMLLNQNDCSHTDIEHYKNPFQLQMHTIFTVHRAIRNCNVSCCGNFR